MRRAGFRSEKGHVPATGSLLAARGLTEWKEGTLGSTTPSRVRAATIRGGDHLLKSLVRRLQLLGQCFGGCEWV